MALPPLGLIPAGTFDLAEIKRLRREQEAPVYLVFPLAQAREARNLIHLLTVLQPLTKQLIDQVWIAYGGNSPQRLHPLQNLFPEVRLFPAKNVQPPDQQSIARGKGATMRAFLYHLITSGEPLHPRAVVLFLDADIRPQYFHPNWVVDPVGAILWFQTVEAAKIVYHRPRGGRLNTMLRSLLALCPHPGIQALQKLAYLLSGEIAGTLNFWVRLPFKTGYGIEILTLLALALDRLQLVPGTSDLTHLVQVYVGQMDHRHAPLTSIPNKRGLDQMAATVFHTLLEVWRQEGWLHWQANAVGLSIPGPWEGEGAMPSWLEVSFGDATLPPLMTLPAVRQSLAMAES